MYTTTPTLGRIIVAAILTLIPLAGCGRAEPPPPAPPITAPSPTPAEAIATPAPTASTTPTPVELDAEATTLESLEQVDDYPLYTMHYYGPYGHQVSSSKGGAGPTWACSLFAALGDTDSMLYGRNFDWEYSPALLLFTAPPDGYRSVSMVDIAYLVDADQVRALTDLPLEDRRPLLDAPFLPFDGMNERGLVVGMAAVPPGDMQPDPNKETVGSLGVIREMLDHAGDVDEAVAILQSYNIEFGDGPPIHYLIADSSGRAVLVEFYQSEMVVIPNETGYHLATNFLRASVGESAAGQCQRYDKIGQRLAETGGRINTQEAIDLLEQVSQEGTQWSVVYEINTGNVNVVMGREYDDLHTLYSRSTSMQMSIRGDRFFTTEARRTLQ